MRTHRRGRSGAQIVRFFLGVVFFSVLAAVPPLHAADGDDFDSYKIKVSGLWFYSMPSGNFEDPQNTTRIDLRSDLKFSNYSTFSAKFDWKISHKNHLYVVVSPMTQSHQLALIRTITFQGQTFAAGLTTSAKLKANLFAPGYQYDIIRRKRGHLGIGVQIDIFDTRASLRAMAQVVNGSQSAAVSASGSLLAPLPVAGPDFRFYLTNSPRLYIEGNVYGMYFFGYGNFVSTSDALGIHLAKHVDVHVGFQIGSRLRVNNNSSTDRIGLRLTQQGVIVGLEFPF